MPHALSPGLSTTLSKYILTLPTLGILQSCVKIKINLNTFVMPQ